MPTYDDDEKEEDFKDRLSKAIVSLWNKEGSVATGQKPVKEDPNNAGIYRGMPDAQEGDVEKKPPIRPSSTAESLALDPLGIGSGRPRVIHTPGAMLPERTIAQVDEKYPGIGKWGRLLKQGAQLQAEGLVERNTARAQFLNEASKYTDAAAEVQRFQQRDLRMRDYARERTRSALFDELRAKNEEVAMHRTDPRRMFRNLGAGEKLFLAIAVGLSGPAGVQMLLKKQEMDIRAQEADYAAKKDSAAMSESLYARYMKQTNDSREAFLRTQRDGLLYFLNKAKALQQRADAAGMPGSTKESIGKIQEALGNNFIALHKLVTGKVMSSASKKYRPPSTRVIGRNPLAGLSAKDRKWMIGKASKVGDYLAKTRFYDAATAKRKWVRALRLLVGEGYGTQQLLNMARARPTMLNQMIAHASTKNKAAYQALVDASIQYKVAATGAAAPEKEQTMIFFGGTPANVEALIGHVREAEAAQKEMWDEAAAKETPLAAETWLVGYKKAGGFGNMFAEDFVPTGTPVKSMKNLDAED